MTALKPDTRRKLVSALRLLGSDKEGERQAALNAALRLLPPGVTLADVVEGSAVQQCDWRTKARAVLCRCGLLDEREVSFVRNLSRARYEPSAKQLQWLADLAQRVGVANEGR